MVDLFRVWKRVGIAISKFIANEDSLDITRDAILKFIKDIERFPTVEDLAELYRSVVSGKSWDRNFKVHNGRNADTGGIKKGTTGSRRAKNKRVKGRIDIISSSLNRFIDEP